MAKQGPPPLPVVLELAFLPREQVGPFLLLGVDKTGGKEQIEACWAQRLIWARKNQIVTPLEDINWAREVLNDTDKRVRADAASLNIDTTDGVLRRLRERYAVGGAGCRPLDVEKPLADYTPAVPMPEPDEVRAAIPLPEIPMEFPAVAEIIERYVQAPLDPWDAAVDNILAPEDSPTG
jgi:hypothetical protein